MNVTLGPALRKHLINVIGDVADGADENDAANGKRRSRNMNTLVVRIAGWETEADNQQQHVRKDVLATNNRGPHKSSVSNKEIYWLTKKMSQGRAASQPHQQDPNSLHLYIPLFPTVSANPLN